MRSEAPAGKSPRLFFIDHWRAALAVLVVLHHVAIVYGAAAPFYYVEPPDNDPRAFLVLLVFVLVNQSWFMGAFFLLAGYFTPESFDRKGPGPYLKDRLVRLGLPLVAFIFVLNPIACIGFYQMPKELTGITTPLTWRAYPDLLGMGPMWFVAILLVFTFGYAGWRALRNRASVPGDRVSSPGYVGMGVFILVLAAASYLLRIMVPIGKAVAGFPTLAYFPQYLSFFVIGTIAARRDWFRMLPDSMGVAGLITAGLAGVILFPLAFSGHFFSLSLSPALTKALGNGNLQSGLYVLWDSIFAVGMCLGLITIFRRYFNGQSRFGRFLSQQSYAVYVLHIPILVFLALALRGVEPGALAKFGLAAVIVLPVCFGLAYLVRKMPLVSRSI